MILLALAGVGWLLATPGQLSGVRLFGVALAWWAAFAVFAVDLLALSLGPRARRRLRRSP